MNNRLSKSIQQILLAGTTAAFAAGVFALPGRQFPPPGAGQIPDYFGITPNYATSPQPVLANVTGGTGTGAAATTYNYALGARTNNIMDVQGGTGYRAGDTLTITGNGASCSGVLVTNVSATGSIMPIVDATGVVTTPSVTGLGFCTGFTKPIVGTGIRKFIDSLSNLSTANNLGQQLPIAVADTTTFPGSDYYEIAETQYTQQLHTDLPATTLRGYKQLNAPAGSAALNNHYLGPIIVAQKGRPVRVKLVNQLPIGPAGKLPIPVDTTYMGTNGATDTDNRTALHLHGGNTPWISDGTPRQWVKPAAEVAPNKGDTARNVPDMWFDPTGALIVNSATCTQGTTVCTTANATNDPGYGALTFFYTNQQSARLMFYHDHAEGTTRLNVYNGMAAGYVLQDPTEQNLVANGTLPTMANTIPLVIQEKTFVPDKTKPVLNFYGPFASQLASQDPTWRWGTGSAVSATNPLNGNGDLWVPHVFMPNQNPGTVSGVNAVGRWDYGPWFWPPFVNIQNGQIANPYYDPTCNTTTSYCEGAFMPGVPNGSQQAVLSNGVAGGVTDASNGGAKTESPSGTPEAFNDTPLVNGTAYPYTVVAPTKYRLRILSVGNDRMLNLSLVLAASKNSVDALGNIGTVADANIGAVSSAVLCDGTTTYPANYPVGVAGTVPTQADCTEVKMVPFTSGQNTTTGKAFPTWWYTKQNAGITFDGRPSGVFDPATRGPQMVQIGTEGGFLSTPVGIKNQPVNYEYNPKNILIGNVKEHALLLGPAERADVIVDFTNFAGSTLILYNDNPAPMPAWDLRLDYYTGGFDNTDTGGAFSVVPGYGPNSRTLMQFRVSGTGGTHPVDDLGTISMATLTPSIQTAFKTSQEPIIVPQSPYNATYGLTFADTLGGDLSRITDNTLTYSPLSPRDVLGNFTLLPPLTIPMELQPKTIIEDWTQNWGRMNALLGSEIPRTTALIATAIPQGFVDPPTDLVKITPNDNIVPISGTAPDGTQIWKITHNGVDSHVIHFHLFHVQIVNRVGWDGAIYTPDANELGWKDSVRMNPLSDTIVALRPMTMTALPFKTPNSHRLLMPTMPVNATSPEFFSMNPQTGSPLAPALTNQSVNFGWEYLWHCHILGHEENDMMRTIAVAQPPEAPVGLTAITVATGVRLDWTDSSVISNWVKIQRSTESTFATAALITTVNVIEQECAVQAGCLRTYTDTTAPANTSVYYRVMANNTVGAGDGQLDVPRLPNGAYGGTLPPELSTLVPGFTGYANVTANSNWTTVPRLFGPIAGVSPATLVFPNTTVLTTSAPLTATLTNTGNAVLNISSIAATAPFARATGAATGTCGATLAAPVAPATSTSCTIGVTFTPTAVGAAPAGTLTITDNSTPVTQTVSLSGTGVAAAVPVAGVSPAMLAFPNTSIGSTSLPLTATLSNTGASVLNISSIATSGSPFAISTGGTCAATLAAASTCTINVTFTPTIAVTSNGTLTITDNATPVTQTVSLSGTGVAAVVPVAGVSPATLAFPNTSIGSTSLPLTATLSNTGTGVLNISSIATSGSPFAIATGGTCAATLAAASTCTINVTFTPTIAVTSNGTLTITDNATPSTQTVSLSGTGGAAAGVPVVGLSATTMAFGNVIVGGNATQLVTLTNLGTAPLTINSSLVNGTGFTRRGSSTCGTSLAVGAACNINVRFAPTALGIATGSLVITDNATPSTQTVTLSGTGVPVAANNDTATVAANTNTTQNVTVNVRANDVPTNGTVAIISSTFSNAGAGATVAVNNNSIRWTLTGATPTPPATTPTLQVSKRGTYTVVYSMRAGGVTVQATAILTVN